MMIPEENQEIKKYSDHDGFFPSLFVARSIDICYWGARI